MVENLRNGLLRQAIYVNLTKNVTVDDAAVKAYYTKNKKTYATPASRADPPHPGQEQGAGRQDLPAARDERRAVRGAREEVHDRSRLEEERREARQHPEGADRPGFDKVAFSVATGKVATPVKSSYGWHVIEATGDTVPASQQPLDAALKKTDPHHPPDPEEAERRQQVVRHLPEEDREERALRGRLRAGQDDQHRASTARRHRPQRDDAARGGWLCAWLARRRRAGRLRREQRSGSNVPAGDVAVVDGNDITVAELQTTMNIARLSIKTSYPEPGTETGSRCARERSSRWRTTPSCAPGRATSASA